MNPSVVSIWSRRGLLVSIIWLIITALLGVFLRISPWYGLPGIAYANLLHGHSHVAFLGWVFNALFVLITSRWLLTPENARYYNRLFTGLQISVTGMLIFFPLYGYNPLTIAISAVHTFLSILFSIRFFRQPNADRSSVSYQAIIIALVFMLLSAVGPLLLAPLSISGLKTTIWYNLAIYFYLHFQYNGWFLFGILGVGFAFLEAKKIGFRRDEARKFIWLTAAGTLPAYALSCLWVHPPAWVYGLAVLGTGLQLFSLVYAGIVFRQLITGFWLSKTPRLILMLLFIAAIALLARNVLQFAGSLPGLAQLAGIRPIVIAFLHLHFLGLVTPALIAFFMITMKIRTSGTGWAGFYLFITGFVISESSLFLSPFFVMPFSAFLLPEATVIIAVGISLMSLNLIQKTRSL